MIGIRNACSKQQSYVLVDVTGHNDGWLLLATDML